MINTYTTLHCHSEISSAVLRFADAICHIKDSMEWCYENNLRGYAITDHQSCSGYVTLEQSYNALNVERPFQHIFGNECYLISQDEDNLRFSENQRPYYWHYLVNVLDPEGLKQMYELSARAWLRSYTYKGLLRRPNFYSDFEEVVGNNPGHLVVSTACVSGYLPHCILTDDMINGDKFIKWNQQVFGKDNFYLECQPCYSDNEEQIKVNKTLWKIHEEKNIPIIVTTDAHYQRPEDRFIHTTFLKSKDGGDSREPEKFYKTTYLFTPQELRERLYDSGFNDNQIDIMFQTTNEIADKVQSITIKKTTRVPSLPSLPEFEIKHKYKEYYEKYPLLKYYANSSDLKEQHFYYEIEKGLIDLFKIHPEYNLEEYLSRENLEMEQIFGLGKVFKGERMSDYFTVVQKVIDLIWSKGDSLVGIGRGSAGCYLTNFLLGITGINPMLEDVKEFYPWWRFCSIARSESIFDIDIDVQSFKKEQIIKAIKDYFGERKVCQCVTWGTLSAKTALEKAGKGLGIPDESIGFLKSLIKVKRGKIYSLKDCLYGNPEKGREKVPEFIKEINKYPDLLRVALAFEGMIVSSGVHAGALNVLKEDFTETGSLMVSSSGSIVSQFDLHHAEYAGDLKFDLLSIDCLQTIRAELDSLLAHNYIKWQGSLRKTYNKYLKYDSLELSQPKMWDLLPTMLNAFQYDTMAGKQALRKIQPRNVTELTLSNGLMRLQVENGEQPMDKYVRYRKNINDWYKDMDDFGVPKDEQEILKKYLLIYSGLCITQSTTMAILMDKNVCNFTMKEADRARKSIAKRNEEALKETEEKLYSKGKGCGRSKAFLDYLWKVQIEMSKAYAFDGSHSHEYSIECIQEMNLYFKFPKVFWNCAVVTTQSQSEDERERSSNTKNYSKIAQSIYKAKENDVLVDTPDINKSELSFTPLVDEDKILFGLGGVTKINRDVYSDILSGRPYNSFKEFYDYHKIHKFPTNEVDENGNIIYRNSSVTRSIMIVLIKSGCFNYCSTDRVTMIKWLVTWEFPAKTELSTSNLPKALELGCTFSPTLVKTYKFRKYVLSPQFFYKKNDNFKSKKDYILEPKFARPYFEEKYIDKLTEDKDYYYENDMLIVVDKSLDKVLKPELEALSKEMNNENIIKEFNKKNWQNEYLNLVKTENQEMWYFDTVSYFPEKHVLWGIDKNFYNIQDYKDLPQEPQFIEKSDKSGKRTWRIYDLSKIAGCVLSRQDDKHYLNVLTTDGKVVIVRFNAGQYAYYKRDIAETDEYEADKSWLSRGSILIISGYRRGEDEFVAKKYRNSIYRHSVIKVTNINPDRSLDLQFDRIDKLDEGDDN